MRIGLVGLLVLVQAACDATGVEICGNGLDDDIDGLTDCEDALCRCSTVELCSGGLDEDGDLLIDCADDDCVDEAVCIESLCDDTVDNDGDGDVDCADTDCDGGCPEACDDGRDNDGDGLIDCEDSDCVDAEACGELLCADGLDDDGDGLVDCADDDCWGLACHPNGVTTTITNGEIRLVDAQVLSTTRVDGYYTSYVSGTIVDIECGTGEETVVRTSRTTATLSNIQGVASVQVPGDGGSVTELCNFSFTELVAEGEATLLTPGPRTGFVVQDAARCRLDGTSWLPRTLTRNGDRLDAGVVRRYATAMPQFSQDSTSGVNTTTYNDGCLRYVSTLVTSQIMYGGGVTGDALTVTP